MIVCGTTLSGSTATVIVLEGSADDYYLVDTGITKFELNDSDSAEDVKNFYDSFHSFVKHHHIEKIGIKKRNPKAKGKHASGPLTFKIEGLIQLSHGQDVVLIHPNTISAKIRKNTPKEVKIFKYQTEAYETAFSIFYL